MISPRCLKVKLTGHRDVLDNGFKEDKNEREDIPDIAGAESEPGRRLEMLGRYRLWGLFPLCLTPIIFLQRADEGAFLVCDEVNCYDTNGQMRIAWGRECT